MALDEMFRPLRDDPPTSGIFLNFDGTLADIVGRPEDAAPLPDVPPLLRRLSDRYGAVAVISGRSAAEVRARINTPGIEIFGQYGLQLGAGVGSAVAAVRDRVRLIASLEPGAWMEDKGDSLAVHYRATPDTDAAAERLAPPMRELAEQFGLALLPGKMVLELAPAETPGKGVVILREARRRGLRACMYAGDDVADLVAFAALDELRRSDVRTVKVAVASEESPPELLEAADVVVERPAGLVPILSELAEE